MKIACAYALYEILNINNISCYNCLVIISDYTDKNPYFWFVLSKIRLRKMQRILSIN